MSRITLYLAKAVLWGTTMVLVVLVGISFFLGFLGELEKIGGGYTMPVAFLTVALEMPELAYQMAPLAALIGSLLGLGGLASGSELIVMRAAGMSLWRLGRAVVLAGVLAGIGVFVLGDWIGPWGASQSEIVRHQAKTGGAFSASSNDVWFRDGNRYVNVSKLSDSRVDGRILSIEFDSNGELKNLGSAASADIEGSRWFLNDATSLAFVADRADLKQADRQPWDTGLTPDLVDLFTVNPDGFSTWELYQYVRYLKANKLDPAEYEQALWSKLVVPASVVIMSLLALPFVMGALRDTGNGQRLVTGVVIGIVYFLANQLLRDSTVLFGINPVLAAWLPTLALLGVTVVALRLAR